METGPLGREADMLADRTQLEHLLAASEQRLAIIPTLETRISDLEHDLIAARMNANAADERTRQLDGELTRSREAMVDVLNSVSWQVTRPLRRVEQLLR
jgi:hypothetical protein